MRNRHPKVHPDWRVPAGLMLLGSLLAWPSVAAAEDASCTLSPKTVNVGGTVNWSASVTGIASSGTYRWTLGGGTPSSSTSRTPAVQYNTAGTFETKLRVDDSRNDDECKTKVTVRASSSDTQSPTTPSNLNAAAVSSSQINLGWSASTDNVGVTGYRVYRCTGSSCTPTTQIATTTTTSYSDTGRSANTTYRYRVRAQDAAGNLSSYSITRSATTSAASDTAPPTAPSNLTAAATSTTQINLSWGASTDNVGVTGYQIWRCTGATCTNFAQIATSTAATYSNTGLTASTAYRYQVRATDAAGNLSGYSTPASATTQSAADTQAPSVPSSLTAAATSTTQINLSWGASTDNVGVTGYQIWRCTGATCTNFAQIATSTAATYSNTGLTASTAYRYQVRATDAAGNLSGYSTPASATTQSAADTQAPSVPSSLTAAATSTTQINLSWGASTDNVGVTGYQIWRCTGATCTNFAQIATSTAATYSNTGLTASTAYRYQVRATDAAGNLSGYSTPASATTQSAADTQAPSVPSSLTAAATSTTQINLSWGASTDNVGVTGYQIWRCTGATCTNFAQIATSTAATYSNTGLTASTAYRYQVRATDAAGNLSGYSTPASATTQSAADTQAPSVPSSLTAAATSTTQINLSWGASTDNVGVTGYQIWRCTGATCTNFAQIATSTAATYSNTGLTASTAYRYQVRATDAAGNLSGYSTPASATTTGAQACVPTQPALAHAECITEYTGPEVCVACHAVQARDMHGSVHYQQNGPTDYVTNIAGPAGERGFDFAETGINTYCGTHENSPRFTCAGCHVGNGRFPKTPAEMGFPSGDFKVEVLSVGQLNELANIDCLTCHQEVYKRFPDPAAGFEELVLENVCLTDTGALADPGAPGTVCVQGPPVTRTGLAGIPIVHPVTLDFDFVPADPTNPLLAGIPAALMSITGLEAAQTVHPTTRKSCLNCHAGAAGADGAKRGDLNSQMASPSITLDRHMSPAGSDMTCSDCHSAGNHRIFGRGLDLRANDVPPVFAGADTNPAGNQFACTACHTASTVHNAVTNGATFARHVAKVACQTCHIPSYGKGVATEIARDWQAPHVSQTACNGRGGWLPEEVKSSTVTPPVPVTPSYQWFDGTSEVYYLGESLIDVPTVPLAANVATAFKASAGASAVNFDTNDPAFVLGVPTAIVDPTTGAINKALGAKIADAKIYPMKEHWGKLARHNDSNALIGHSTYEFFRTGNFDYAVEQGMAQSGLTGSYDVVPVHTFQTLNHGVEPQANALGAANRCGNCHSGTNQTGGPPRMDLKAMGYRIRPNSAGFSITVGANGTSTCTLSCHGKSHDAKTGTLTSIHGRAKHLEIQAGQALNGCNACHDQITGR